MFDGLRGQSIRLHKLEELDSGLDVTQTYNDCVDECDRSLEDEEL